MMTGPTRVAVAALTLSLALSVSACSELGPATTDQQSYEITEPVTALVVDGRKAKVTIETGEGPVTVTEVYHYSADKPGTAHVVEGTTLRLRDTGCQDDEGRCEVEFRVRVPSATAATVVAQAGAVDVTGLAGDLTVTTDAGAVEATDLAGGRVSITTQAGAATLDFARPPAAVDASTTVGAVEVTVPGNATYAVDVDTTVGAADVTVPHDPAADRTITIRTDVGAVRVRNG